jgi:hypothetical protein
MFLVVRRNYSVSFAVEILKRSDRCSFSRKETSKQALDL